jgi:sugar lactone lactonase YvrE
MPSPVCSLAPRRQAGFIAATAVGFCIVTPGKGVEVVCSPTAAAPRELLNDGRCDAAGRFWCASIDRELREPLGKLYRLDSEGRSQEMDEGFTTGNGLAFSPECDRLYAADSRAETVWVYDFDLVKGMIARKQRFFSTVDLLGRVDGAAMDCDGNYWCAMVEGWAVLAIDRRGKIIERVPLPVEFPTMCTFGGANRDILYVTTSTLRLSERKLNEQPLAGSLLAIHGLGARGAPAATFAG